MLKIILLTLVMLLIVFVIYKVGIGIIRLVIGTIENRVDKKHASEIAAEIQATKKMLDDVGIERISREEAIRNGKQYPDFL